MQVEYENEMHPLIFAFNSGQTKLHIKKENRTMKTKKLSKRLGLNKTTISNLNHKEMYKAVGGVSGPGTTCMVTKLITCGNSSCDTACFSIANGPCYVCHECDL